MSTEQSVIKDITDKGGMFDITKQFSRFIYNSKEWTYIATGLVREVFRSDCGNFVIKIPKSEYRFDHNILEWEVYRDAPDWCKEHIAKTELTKENYVIQEYVKVNLDAGNFYREIGNREADGKLVIFDCDIFLDSRMKKPEQGFRYQQVFCKSSSFGTASIKAKELAKKQRLTRQNYFPNIDNQKYREIGNTIYIDELEVPLDIATECGFTYESKLGYE